MQMVAASKMRTAQQLAIEVRPFVRLLYRIQRMATTHANDFTHPLLEVRPVRMRAVVLVAADKGLCGSLNTNVFRVAAQYNSASTLFLWSRAISPGRGSSRPGKYDIVTVKYTLWTADGRTIDTSSIRAQPSRWTMSELAEGLQLGLALMVAGEARRLWIPPGLSYDWAKSTLVFDVELLNIEAVSDPISDADLLGPPADAPRMPNGVAYRVLRPADSGERPKSETAEQVLTSVYGTSGATTAATTAP